jgi:MFS family permease
VPRWTGLLAAASFALGLPLAPLWGVWADKYSRKLIIVRSALGEALIFLIAALSQSVWHLLLARVLVGFILGNTGVMYAALAGVAPRHQLASPSPLCRRAARWGNRWGRCSGATSSAGWGFTACSCSIASWRWAWPCS